MDRDGMGEEFAAAGQCVWGKMAASVQYAVNDMTPGQRIAFWGGLLEAVARSAAADAAAVRRQASAGPTMCARLEQAAETLGWMAARLSALPEARAEAAAQALVCATAQSAAMRLAKGLEDGKDAYDALSALVATGALTRSAKGDLLRAALNGGSGE